MQRTLIAVLLLLFPLSVVAESPCARIVTLAPSLTEIVFELGLGGKLVGVSAYSMYPPEAKNISRVGALLDPNLERIVAVRPTVVFGLSEQESIADSLRALGLRVEVLDHRGINAIVESVELIGKTCQSETVAAEVVARLRGELRVRCRGTPPERTRRVLVVVGGEGAEDNFSKLFVSGEDGMYADALRCLGARNVIQGETRSAAALSLEALLSFDPDDIVEIAAVEPDRRSHYEQRARVRWSELRGLQAVRNNRVHFLLEDYASIPGPRVVRMLEALENALSIATP